ncbi:hypothetical protein ACQEWB_12430 [Streptomyces sp. CA-249302]|uniref:hypothetical protein n=1 Tax=Streptomyces sp. CA-249302 TaxID=3240058 RepID=UPI003D9033C6
MGIRMLNRRPARAQASVESAPVVPPAPVPAFAADASTARIPTDLATALRSIPTDLATTLRRTATDLRRRLPGRTVGPADRAEFTGPPDDPARRR